MYYIDTFTGHYPLSLEDVRRLLFRVSLPKKPTEKQLEKYGIFLVEKTPKPVGNDIVEGTPRRKENKFFQTWSVTESANLEEKIKSLKNRYKKKFNDKLKRGYVLNNSESIKLENNISDLSLVLNQCLLLKQDTGNSACELWLELTSGGFKTGTYTQILNWTMQTTNYYREIKRDYLVSLNSLTEALNVGTLDQLYEKEFGQNIFEEG